MKDRISVIYTVRFCMRWSYKHPNTFFFISNELVLANFLGFKVHFLAHHSPLETCSWLFVSMKMYAWRHTLHLENVSLIFVCTTKTYVHLFAKPKNFFTWGELFFRFPRIFANLFFFPDTNPVFSYGFIHTNTSAYINNEFISLDF